MGENSYLVLHVQLKKARKILNPVILVEEHLDSKDLGWCAETSDLVEGLVCQFPGLVKWMSPNQESNVRQRAHHILETKGFETHDQRKEFLWSLSKALKDLGSKGVIPADSERPGDMWRILMCGGVFLSELAQEFDPQAKPEATRASHL